MSVRHISRMDCPACGAHALHIAKKCQECGHAQEFAKDIVRKGLRKLFIKPAGSPVGFINPRAGKALADVRQAKLQQRVEAGYVELSAAPKRPRCINSERRPVKP